MVFCCILQYFVAKSVFLQFTLFCREISFGTIYALLRGEKFSKKLCPWRKNDKYEVWMYFFQPKSKLLHWSFCVFATILGPSIDDIFMHCRHRSLLKYMANIQTSPSLKIEIKIFKQFVKITNFVSFFNSLKNTVCFQHVLYK